MSDPFKDMLDEALEKITDTLEKAKSVLELSNNIDDLLGEYDFPIVMSVLNIALAKAIIDESENYGDAYAFAARVLHTLVDVIDKHKEKSPPMEEDNDNEEQVH